MVTPSFPQVALLAAAGAGAGWLGALIGIGGGILLVPTLVLGFGVDMRIAVATSLVAVIATSTAAGSVYVGSGQANMRLGMSLEVATTVGGVVGGLVSQLLPGTVIAGIFSAVVGLTAALMIRDVARRTAPAVAVAPAATAATPANGYEDRGRLAGAYWDPLQEKLVRYEAHRLWLGTGVSLVAGAMSGLLGVGGGFLKVPAMTLGMRVPIKVAAATSNFMIGVTAASSVFVYYGRGDVRALIAAPVAIGVVCGAMLGTRSARRASHARLAMITAIVLTGVAIEMGLKAFGVGLGD